MILPAAGDYDVADEAFPVALMRLIDYDEDADGVVTVKNATAHLHRFLDATGMAEVLYGWVEETVREEFAASWSSWSPSGIFEGRSR